MVASTKALRDNIISLCLETDCIWPFVSIAGFEQRHARFLERSKAKEVALVPLVSDEDRYAWEEYTRDNHGWIQEGLDSRNENVEHSDITPFLHIGYHEKTSGAIRDPGPGEYAAYWQIAPAPVDPKKVNLNSLSDDVFDEAFHWISEYHVPLFSAATNSSQQEPQVFLLQPLTDDFHGDTSLVGSLVTTALWGTFFETILPDYVQDILVVVSNTCDQSFTYILNGANATFLGEGDLHDSNFDSSVVSALFNPFSGNRTSYEPFCEYTISVYPTEEFLRTYDSNDPLVYTGVVMIIMTLTICIFCIYDFCGE